MFPYGHPDHRPPQPADLAELADVDPATLDTAGLSRALDGIEADQRQVDACRLALLGEYEARQAYAAEGAVSAAAALGYRHGRDGRTLRRDVTTATKLRKLPLLAKTLRAGRITAEHAEVLTRAMTAKTEDALVADEGRLVALAEKLDVERYRLAVRHWKAHADPDGTEDPNAHLRRELFLSQSLDGDWFLKGRLDAEAGATVKDALDHMLDELHRAGDSGSDEPPLVPAPQRRADGLVELCRRGGGVTGEGAAHRRTRPQIVVTIDHDNLINELGLAELGDGGTISARSARRLACDADIISAVFDGNSELLDLGRRARLVSPAQRMALAMRDRGCAFPNCDRPPTWCDAHHIEHWLEHDGATDLDNLCLLCSRHHHLLHEGGWTLHREGSGELVFTEPGGLNLANRSRPPGHPDPWLGHPPDPEPPARGAPGGDER